MIAFCHSYKTAGTTFTLLLRNHFKLRHFDRPGFRHRLLRAEHLRNISRIYPGIKSIGGHPVRPYSDLNRFCKDIRYYTFVRDPVRRAVSHFTWFLRYKAHDDVVFDDFEALLFEWARAPVNRNLQCRHLSPVPTCEGVKHLHRKTPLYFLLVSEFDTSLHLFRQWAGEPEMPLFYQPRNTHADSYERIQTSHPDYLARIKAFKRELDAREDLLDMLREANLEDQKLLDWVNAEIWPRQCEAYPGDLSTEVAGFRQRNRHTGSAPPEPWQARLYRNAVFKPLRPLLLPVSEPDEFVRSPWV